MPTLTTSKISRVIKWVTLRTFSYRTLHTPFPKPSGLPVSESKFPSIDPTDKCPMIATEYSERVIALTGYQIKKRFRQTRYRTITHQHPRHHQPFSLLPHTPPSRSHQPTLKKIKLSSPKQPAPSRPSLRPAVYASTCDSSPAFPQPCAFPVNLSRSPRRCLLFGQPYRTHRCAQILPNTRNYVHMTCHHR